MWQPLLIAVITLGLLAPQELRPEQLVQRARTEKELSAAIEKIEESGTEIGKSLRLAQQICAAWERLQQPGRARAFIEGLKGRVAEHDEPYRLLLLSEHLQRTGHVDDAVATAKQALDRARDPVGAAQTNPRERRYESPAILRLAEALEAQGSYRQAIERYEEWRPAPSFCGTEDGSGLRRCAIAIARCRAALGEVDAALDGLFAVAVHRHGPSLEAVRDLCALAARHQRMSEIRTRLADAELSDAQRVRLKPYLSFGDALESQDPAALLTVAAIPLDPPVIDIVASAYASLDEDAIEDLCKRIVRGDRVAVSVAAHGRIKPARRALLSRAAMSLDPRERSRLETIAHSLE